MANFFYRWTFDLIGNCLPEYRKNGQRVYPINNSIIISDAAGEQIFKIIISCAVRNLKVWKDSVVVFDKGNVVNQEVIVGTNSCQEYTPADGESCKTGYSGKGGNYRHVFSQIIVTSDQSNYVVPTFPEIDRGVLVKGSNFTVTRLTSQTFTVGSSKLTGRLSRSRIGSSSDYNYYNAVVRYVIPKCIPPVNCQTSITEEQEVWNTNPLEFSDTVAPAAAPAAPAVPEVVPEVTPAAATPKVEIPVSPGDAAANDNYIIALVEAAKRSGRSVTFGPEGLSDITRQDSKYRIISPETFSLVLGKWVPDIRYESVRYLSPEAASNFIGRGYELLSVTPDTPESTSKPYSQSVIKRQNLVSGQQSKYRQRVTRGRITITQATQGKLQQQNANINKIHGNNRRRIIS